MLFIVKDTVVFTPPCGFNNPVLGCNHGSLEGMAKMIMETSLLPVLNIKAACPFFMAISLKTALTCPDNNKVNFPNFSFLLFFKSLEIFCCVSIIYYQGDPIIIIMRQHASLTVAVITQNE